MEKILLAVCVFCFHGLFAQDKSLCKSYISPPLQVKKIRVAKDGMIGLWDDGLSGDFANLTITR